MDAGFRHGPANPRQPNPSPPASASSEIASPRSTPKEKEETLTSFYFSRILQEMAHRLKHLAGSPGRRSTSDPATARWVPCDATGKTGKTVHAADPMTAVPSRSRGRVSRHHPPERMRRNAGRRAMWPAPSQRPHRRAPASPQFSGIRQSELRSTEIRTVPIRQRMRPEFGPGHSKLSDPLQSDVGCI